MSIPDFAAEWIALTIRDDGQQQQQQQHRDMNALVLSLKSLRGLNSLLVRDLKTVFRKMKYTGLFPNFSRKPTNKADLIAAIRQGFYLDSACTIVNEYAIKGLQFMLTAKEGSSIMLEEPVSLPNPKSSTTPSSSLTTSSNGLGSPGRCSSFPSNLPYTAYTAAGHNPPSFQNPPCQTDAWHVLASLTNNSNQFSRSSPPEPSRFGAPTISAPTYQSPPPVQLQHASVMSARPIAVKQEHHDDDVTSTTATTPAESFLLSQLMNMGFQNKDKLEILQTIRRLVAKGNPIQPPTADAVMIDLITQREEAEEARKEDECRLQSIQHQRQESQRLRLVKKQKLEERLRSASLQEWGTNDDMFSNSWILGGKARATIALLVKENFSLKCKLLKLLKKEKNARKWYQTPARSFFRDCVNKRLAECGNERSLAAQLDKEIATLDVAMYTLSEQKGGVPRIFLEAHDNRSDAGADDEVVVVVDSSVENRHPAQSPTTKKRRMMRSESDDNRATVGSAFVDVIEIL